MFGIRHNVISAKQMIHTVKAKKSSFVQKIVKAGAFGNADTVSRKQKVGDFWNRLKQESKSHGSGHRGLTQSELEHSLAGFLIDDHDHNSRLNAKRAIRAAGVNEDRVFRYAAEMKHHKNPSSRERKAEISAGNYGGSENVGSYSGSGNRTSHQTVGFEGKKLTPTGGTQIAAVGVAMATPTLKSERSLNILNYAPIARNDVRPQHTFVAASRGYSQPTEAKNYLAQLQAKNTIEENKTGVRGQNQIVNKAKPPEETHSLHLSANQTTVKEIPREQEKIQRKTSLVNMPAKETKEEVKMRLASLKATEGSGETKKEEDWQSLLHKPAQKSNVAVAEAGAVAAIGAITEKKEDNQSSILLKTSPAEKVSLAETAPAVPTSVTAEKSENVEEKVMSADNYIPHTSQLDTRNSFGHVRNYNLDYNKHADIASAKDLIKQIQQSPDEFNDKSQYADNYEKEEDANEDENSTAEVEDLEEAA